MIKQFLKDGLRIHRTLAAFAVSVLSASVLNTALEASDIRPEVVAERVADLYQRELEELRFEARVEQTGFEGEVLIKSVMKPSFLRTDVFLNGDLNLQLNLENGVMTESSVLPQIITQETLEMLTEPQVKKAVRHEAFDRPVVQLNYKVPHAYGADSSQLSSDVPLCLIGFYVWNWIGSDAPQPVIWARKIASSEYVGEAHTEAGTKALRFIKTIVDAPIESEPDAVRVEEEYWVDANDFFVLRVKTEWKGQKFNETRDRKIQIVDATRR